MKHFYLLSKSSLLAILAGIVFFANQALGQTTHEITVNNNSFSPANLTIKVGDIVKWTNSSGNHNINGTTETFSSNPESFGNEVGKDWIFSFTFNKSGEYNYQCDPHAGLGMKGKITVENTASIVEKTNNSLKLYPNPVQSKLYFGNLPEQAKQVNIYDITGNLVQELQVLHHPNFYLDVSDLEKGYYVLRITEQNAFILSSTFIKE